LYISINYSVEVQSAPSLSSRSRTKRGNLNAIPLPSSIPDPAVCIGLREKSAAFISQTNLGSKYTSHLICGKFYFIFRFEAG
jgi:hypothetical protein